MSRRHPDTTQSVTMRLAIRGGSFILRARLVFASRKLGNFQNLRRTSLWRNSFESWSFQTYVCMCGPISNLCVQCVCMRVHACACVCMRVHACACVGVRGCMRVHVHACACVCMRVCAWVYACVYSNLCVCVLLWPSILFF